MACKICSIKTTSVLLLLFSLFLGLSSFTEGYKSYISCVSIISQKRNSVKVETLYGSFIVDEPVLIELLNCPQMKRLQGIRQLGIWCKFMHPDEFNRYDHSVGVWALVRRFGGSLEEQVAALLHDASHTAFSHVGAFFFVDDAKHMDDFQDNEHAYYLHHSGIVDILARHKLQVADIHHKDEQFTILEKSLPDICADRFEYNIQGGLWENLITREQAHEIVEAVAFENNTWYFTDVKQALRFAYLPLIMTRTIWGAPENFLTGKWLGQALRRAAELGIITADDVRYSTDDFVWNKLVNSSDKEICVYIEKIVNCRNYFTLDSDYDLILQGKFRGVDPLVKTDQGLQRLTELDEKYAREYVRIKQLTERGWQVMLTEGSPIVAGLA
jgi:hypothetical protein